MGQPDLAAVGRDLHEGRERAGHRDARQRLAAGHVDDMHLRREAVHHEGALAVRMEHQHPRPRRRLDASGFAEGRRIDHRDVVLAAHDHPGRAAVGGEEALVRRAADVGDALDAVGRGVDEGDRVGRGGDRQQRAVVG